MRYILFILIALTACHEAEYSVHKAVADHTEGEAEVPVRDPSCTDHPWLYELSGEIEGSDGAPLENSMVQICINSSTGDYVCQRPVQSDADGAFHIEIHEDYRCITTAVIRALNVSIYSTTYYKDLELPELVEGTNDPTYALRNPIVLYNTRPASVGFETANVLIKEPDTDTTRYPVYFLDGLEIDMVSAYFMGLTGDLLDIRGVRVDPDEGGLDFAPDADQFEGFYGFWPEANVAEGRGFGVRIPNPLGHAIGTKVDLYVLGGLSSTDLEGERIHEGEWRMVGTGTVNGEFADLVWKTYIESDADSKLPCITWLGYKVQ